MTGKEENSHQITDLINHSPVSHKIITPGFVPEAHLAPLMAAAFAYTFPSYYEGFGLPALAAQASATPLIAANATSLPEVCG